MDIILLTGLRGWYKYIPDYRWDMGISKQATTPETPFTFILILDTSDNHGKQLNITARLIILSWLWFFIERS